MRVLVIEDDKKMFDIIALMLAERGITCDHAECGKEGTRLSNLTKYDLIILDVMLPDIDGYEVLLRIRSAKIKTPVLILSGLSAVDKKIKCFGLGADDYLTKPFDGKELIARINAIVRRSRGRGAEAIVKINDLSINLDLRTVEVNGELIHLTLKEYMLLELLVSRRGTILTKEMIFHHLYVGIKEPEIKIVDVFICKLRNKLKGKSGGRNYIETAWGRGYVLREEQDSGAAQIAYN